MSTAFTCGQWAGRAPRPAEMSVFDNPPIVFDAATNTWTETHGCVFRQVFQVRPVDDRDAPSHTCSGTAAARGAGHRGAGADEPPSFCYNEIATTFSNDTGPVAPLPRRVSAAERRVIQPPPTSHPAARASDGRLLTCRPPPALDNPRPLCHRRTTPRWSRSTRPLRRTSTRCRSSTPRSATGRGRSPSAACTWCVARPAGWESIEGPVGTGLRARPLRGDSRSRGVLSHPLGQPAASLLPAAPRRRSATLASAPWRALSRSGCRRR